jgi:hypothetical protein
VCVCVCVRETLLSPEEARLWIRKMKTLCPGKPFGVNLTVLRKSESTVRCRAGSGEVWCSLMGSAVYKRSV